MVKSKNKGNVFEREIAKLLSQSTGVEFRRVPMSGAYSTTTKTEMPMFNGDVYTEEKYYQYFVIECKFHKDPILLTDIFKPKSKLNEWINQSIRESGDKDWVLFFKTNHQPTLLITNTSEIVKDLNLDIIYFKFGPYTIGKI